MKSICLDARKLEIGGIGTYLQNILKNFPPNSFKVTILVPHHCTLDFNGVQAITCDFPDYSIQEQFKFPFVIPSCDLFWSPHFNIPLFPIRAKKRLITLPDIFHLAHASSLSFFERTYAKLFISKSIKKSDHIITVSEFSKREILKFTKASRDKITVIPNGVDTLLFKPSQDEHRHSQVKNKYHLPDQYFLFVGNQKEHKNLRGALEGFATFLAKTPSDSYLLMVGSGKGLRHIEDLEKHLPDFPELKKRVIPLGRVEESDLPLLYQRAIALVFPSLYEGFGLPPIEAMACDCPAIVSKRASLEEVCKDAVYYVDPLDAFSIAKGMEILWKDHATRNMLIEKGRDHAKKFLWEDTTKKHLEIIRELLQ